jgi:hypothetical protein
VLPSPIAPNFTNQGDWPELAPWLLEVCPKGASVDVLYQNHVLRCETFPPLGGGDVHGALTARYKRDLFMPLEGLLSHSVRLDGQGHTQVVFAARQRSSHASVCQALKQAELELGRVAFAGQLALQALRWRCPSSGWSLVSDVTFATSCLLVQGPDGQVMSAALPSDRGGEATAIELMRSWLPKMEPAEQPVDLSAAPADPKRILGGPRLPTPLDFLVPVFLFEPRWRLPSTEDLEYPLFFSNAIWCFSAAMLVLLLWTGSLVWQLVDIASSAEAVGNLRGQKAKLTQSVSLAKTSVDSLEKLAGNLSDIGAEVFDNAAWLTWIGALRDRSATALLFDTVSISGRTVSLTGKHPAAEPVLAFFKALTRRLGESQARFQNVTRTGAGGSRDVRSPRGGDRGQVRQAP